ncbi:MAG: hypothetical protein CEE40_07950 [Chloroflexi bacterium B3_Chlor]|nr:MAG: hypothetical protein CEE40_07950 [Chloroflexi bacterium B3_Chlor]
MPLGHPLLIKEIVMWCHALLLMPVIGLALFAFLPWEMAFPAYAIISVASLFIYYKIMRAMRQPVQSGREAIMGAIATVVTPLDPVGQVRYKNELWSAVSEEKLRPGQPVRVVGLQGMKLIVTDAENPPAHTTRRSDCHGSAGNREIRSWR